jgi:hypothetical protein
MSATGSVGAEQPSPALSGSAAGASSEQHRFEVLTVVCFLSLFAFCPGVSVVLVFRLLYDAARYQSALARRRLRCSAR